MEENKDFVTENSAFEKVENAGKKTADKPQNDTRENKSTVKKSAVKNGKNEKKDKEVKKTPKEKREEKAKAKLAAKEAKAQRKAEKKKKAEKMKKAKAAAMDADDAAEDEAADGGSPEDIAARIAGDRVQFQADILAVARAEAGEDEDGNVIDAPADAAADDDAAEQEDAE